MEVRKRKQRAILSCNDCRRRKLKCDRELPCDRCVAGGYPEKCAYSFVEGEGEGERMPKRVRTGSLPRTGGKDVGADEKDRVELLERQVYELREAVRALRDKSERSSGEEVGVDGGGGEDEDAVVKASVGLFKGKGYRTFYYGPTSPITVVAEFPDLRPFMKQVFIGSTLQSLRQGTKAQEERARAKQNANRILTIPSLRSLLPDRVTVDKILSTYFATLETTYRILHAPTFWSAYEQYWDEAQANDSDMDATILAVLACTLCTTTHDTPRYNANGSSFRSQAIVWIKACEAWLRRQSNKRRSLASLQVRLLRLLALSTTCLKTKEYYQEVQKQMAFMVSSGLHRDPGILGSRCSAFEAEMRRRLWATIMELELQASIDKGISSMLSNLQYDCAAPRNINDSDLHPDMKYLVDSHPHHTFTDTSYLHCSVRSLSLRARLCATANSLQSPPSLSSTLHSEQEIQTALNSLPRWTDPQALMASTLLDVQLRQFLLIIYQPHVLHRSPNFHCFASSSTVYATATALSTAETLINLHYTLNNASIFALTCLRLDYLRAALLIAHIAYYSSSPFTSRIARPTFEATTNAALKLLEERSMRPGRGSHHYWYLSAAISLVQIQFAEADGKGEPEKKKLEREAGDRVCALLYRVMALQQEEGAEGDPAEVILDAGGAGSAGNPNSMQTPASMVEPGFEVDVGQLQGMEGWDAQGTWGLDDFWFLGDSVSGMGAVEGF